MDKIASHIHVFLVSWHIPNPRLCISHFPRFSVFLAIFQVLPCEFLIFLVCQFSRHIPGYTVCVSHFPRFFQFSHHNPGPTVCMSQFIRFSGFSPYSRSYHDFLIFNVCQFSQHINNPTSCVSHFPRFSGFSPYSRSYTVCLIFHVFQFSHHNPGPTVCISHISHFSLFLAIFQVLQCVFLYFASFSIFFALFQILPWFSHFPRLSVFSTYSSSYSLCFSFSTFFRFLAISHLLQWPFLIFQVFQRFSSYSRS